MVRPVIQDCDGLTLTGEEKAVFKDLDPFGFILFGRNCQSPDQLRKLTDEMKETVGRENVPIFIDQEGGRVCRLNPHHWRRPPSGEALKNLYKKDNEKGLAAVRINARLMAEELRHLGITVNCYPLLDLVFPNADQIIGDRSFGDDLNIVSLLAEAACEGLFSGGVLPVIKHIPGHGRAFADSHKTLPIVDTSLDLLQKTDFMPFKALNHMPLAMTAHIVYSAIDEARPATLSPVIIRQVIREYIGFKGVLISDDVCMKALSGQPAHNAKLALQAGCDLVLHCNAPLAERREVLEALYDFNMVNESWVESMFRQRRDIPEINSAELTEWLDQALQ
ncbi:MAG: beta-N-acetylhexosaminidase [Alphaproteobacteria bacterium]|nr:MAG: beta-N-acetylhexosaminidase [Alphaproteobacteria bacterium]